MVLATGIIAATLIVLFGEGPEMFRPHYTIRIRVPEAEGVSQKTAIRKRGILIGRVSEVELLADGVLITAHISSEFRVARNEICRIYPSVIGDADVQFALPPGEAAVDAYFADGDTVEGIVARDPMQVIGDLQGDFAGMIRSVTATTEETRRTMSRVGGLFAKNEDRINSIVANAESNMEVIRQTLQNVNELLADSEVQADVKAAVEELPELMREARATLKQIDQMTASADRNLQSLESFTATLENQGAGVVAKLDDSAVTLRFVLDQMATFSQNLNRTDTSFGLLMHDRQLYDNINQTAANLEELSRTLRPVINDARVFSDKIARHPELLGVRGAMQQSSGTKGTPPYPTFR